MDIQTGRGLYDGFEEGDLRIVTDVFVFRVSSAHMRAASSLFRNMMNVQKDPGTVVFREQDFRAVALVLRGCTQRPRVDVMSQTPADLIGAITFAHKWRCHAFVRHVTITLNDALVAKPRQDVGVYALAAACSRNWPLFGACLGSLEQTGESGGPDCLELRRLLDPREQSPGEIKYLIGLGRDHTDILDGALKGYYFFSFLTRAAIAAIRSDQTIDYADLGMGFVEMMEDAEEQARYAEEAGGDPFWED